MSLANLVGAGRLQRTLSMGDQMQLGHFQGSHPDESGNSILDYLLQDKATISPDVEFFFQNFPNVQTYVLWFQNKFMTDDYFQLM